MQRGISDGEPNRSRGGGVHMLRAIFLVLVASTPACPWSVPSAIRPTGPARAHVTSVATALPTTARNQNQRVAVERIVTAEFMGLANIVRKGGKPLWMFESVREWAVTRGPIIHWSVDTWARSCLEVDNPNYWSPTLRRLELHPWQVFRPMSVGSSLQVLEPQLRLKVLQGFWSAPFRTCRLLLSSLRVWMFASLPLRIRKVFMPTMWPRLLEHLARVSERQQESEMGRVRFARLNTLLRDAGVPGLRQPRRRVVSI